MALSAVPSETQFNFWSGEIEDLTVDWTARTQYSARASATYGTTATGANGSGWTGVGESASGFTFWLPAGFSAGVSATAIGYYKYLTASAGGPTSASASSLTGLQTIIRIHVTGAPQVIGTASARLQTSSGRELREVFRLSIQG